MVRKLVFSVAELTRKLSVSQSSVSFSVKGGENIAQAEQFELAKDKKVIILWASLIVPNRSASILPNVANNRCKWSAAEFASELICLVRAFLHLLLFQMPYPILSQLYKGIPSLLSMFADCKDIYQYTHLLFVEI